MLCMEKIDYAKKDNNNEIYNAYKNGVNIKTN